MIKKTKTKAPSDHRTYKSILAAQKTFNKKANIDVHTRSLELDTLPILDLPEGFKVKLGFEIECLTSASNAYLKEHIGKFTTDSIKVSRLPTNIANTWRIHGDGSIHVTNIDSELFNILHNKTKNNKGYLNTKFNNIEISSAAMDWPIAWKNYIKTVKLLQTKHAYTNSTCGLHMSVSIWHKTKVNARYQNVTKRALVKDFVNFINIHEADLLHIWGRNDNPYCMPIGGQLAKSRPNHKYFNYYSFNDVRASNLYVNSKYQTYNLNKLYGMHDPYIECRIPGNAHCHLRFIDLYGSMSIFTNMLVKSINENMNTSMYDRINRDTKLYKTLIKESVHIPS